MKTDDQRRIARQIEATALAEPVGHDREIDRLQISRHLKAEGKGFEPSTGFPAPDFESHK